MPEHRHLLWRVVVDDVTAHHLGGVLSPPASRDVGAQDLLDPLVQVGLIAVPSPDERPALLPTRVDRHASTTCSASRRRRISLTMLDDSGGRAATHSSFFSSLLR